jgi:hypothetical protein
MIPLNSAGFASLTRPVLLTATKALFVMKNNNIPVEAGHVVWKRTIFWMLL